MGSSGKVHKPGLEQYGMGPVYVGSEEVKGVVRKNSHARIGAAGQEPAPVCNSVVDGVFRKSS